MRLIIKFFKLIKIKLGLNYNCCSNFNLYYNLLIKKIMKEDIKKENNEQSDLQNDNLTKDNFLFVLSVEKIDISFLCGCTLFAGIRFISIFMVIIGLTNIYYSYKNENYLDFILSFIYSFLYFISGFYLFKSSISLSFYDANIGYKIYASLFLFELFLFISNSFLTSIGIINPLGEGKLFLKKYIFYLIGGLFFTLIKLNFIWITFSYMIHLKLNRIKVIMLEK